MVTWFSGCWLTCGVGVYGFGCLAAFGFVDFGYLGTFLFGDFSFWMFGVGVTVLCLGGLFVVDLV